MALDTQNSSPLSRSRLHKFAASPHRQCDRLIHWQFVDMGAKRRINAQRICPAVVDKLAIVLTPSGIDDSASTTSNGAEKVAIRNERIGIRLCLASSRKARGELGISYV